MKAKIPKSWLSLPEVACIASQKRTDIERNWKQDG